MVEAIVREIAIQKDYLGREPIGTVYFGGGTPSLLNEKELLLIFQTIKENFQLKNDAEITLEANPDDLNPSKLRELRSAGINRLSIGIQSFRDEILKFFNRAHNAAQSFDSINDARAAGFNNISIDLIYGVPGVSWSEELDRALSFHPEHISAYSLTIEERTVFGKWKAARKLTPMDEGHVAEQFEMLMDRLTKKGYDHYEISNFSLPGFHSRHNSSYWSDTKYLGVGPSAHSYDGTSRQANVSNNAVYIRRMEAGEIPFEREQLSAADKINEYFLIGLRTSKGCDLEYLEKNFGFSLSSEQHRYVENLVGLGHITILHKKLILTNKGKLLADKIAADLFVSQ